MKVFIVGAGAVASALCKCLSKEKNVKQIVCASNNPKRAKEFIKTDKKVKLLSKTLDASNSIQVAQAAKGFDLIVNASLPNFNEVIMQAALQSKTNYLDLCSLLKDNKTAEQLKYHNRFKKAGLIALINAGIAPGITNILAAEGKDKFERIDEIKIRAIEEQKASQLIFAWSPEVALDELMANPLVYKKGSFSETKPFEDSEDYDFPLPVGKKRVVSIYADEVATIPLYLKVAFVDCKVCGTDIDLAGALSRLGLFSKEPIKFGGASVKPVEFFSKLAPAVPSPKEMVQMMKKGLIEEALYMAIVEISGKQSGKKVKLKNTVIFPAIADIMKRMPGATYISYPTAVAAASFIKVLPKIKNTGVFPPEALSSQIRRDILIELEGYGITVQQEYSRI